MQKKTSFTYELTGEQQKQLAAILTSENYLPATDPNALVAVSGPDYRVSLYRSGKCLVQGKGAGDFVLFVLEPRILGAAGVGYEDLLDPAMRQPHMGVDESGKGDFFGPLVIAAAYVDENLVGPMQDLGVKDSKRITSDKKLRKLAADLMALLKGKFAVVPVGPAAYNRLYSKMRNLNRLLAWGHARAIENLLSAVPSCPRAVSDQFGNKRLIENALMKNGRKIKLEQMPRAESDLAVAAASILARSAFLHALDKLQAKYDVEFPKGASAKVREAAGRLVEQHGAAILTETAKCHFRTADVVLNKLGMDRAALQDQP